MPTPAPAFPCRLLDFELPLALLFAREAALRPLKAQLRRLKISENAFRLARALTLAGEPLSQAEAARRSGVHLGNVRRMTARRAVRNVFAWADGAEGSRLPRLTVTGWGAQQVHVMANRLRQPDVVSWDALAERPQGWRFPERARRALWPLLALLQRAAEGEAVLSGMNEPPAIPADGDLTLDLPQQLFHTRAALLARLRPVLRAHGLTEVQWRVLRMLAEDERVAWPVMALYRRGGFHKGTSVPRVLAALKRRGLVMPEQPDLPTKRLKLRKRKRAQITLAGRGTVAAVERDLARACADLFARLERADMELLSLLLSRLTASLLWRRDLHVMGREQESLPFEAEYTRVDSWRLVRDKLLTARRRSRLYARGILARPRALTRWHEAR